MYYFFQILYAPEFQTFEMSESHPCLTTSHLSSMTAIFFLLNITHGEIDMSLSMGIVLPI